MAKTGYYATKTLMVTLGEEKKKKRLVRSCSDNQGRPGQDDIVNSLNTAHTGTWTYSTVQHCAHKSMDTEHS